MSEHLREACVRADGARFLKAPGRVKLGKIHLGVPQFISARPLVYGLMRVVDPRIVLNYNEPTILAEMLTRGEIDAALIPSIEFLRGAGHYLVNGPGLVARPGHGSAVLIASKPLCDLKRVAVSEHCRTPVATLRIALSDLHGVLPDLLVEKHIDANWRKQYDAVLLTSDCTLDQGICAPIDSDTTHDVASMWAQIAAVPLVAAVWAYSSPALATELEDLLITSRNLGIQNLSRLADGISRTTHYDSEALYEYLSTAWSYQIGETEAKGLRLFEKRALEFDLLRKGRLESVTAG